MDAHDTTPAAPAAAPSSDTVPYGIPAIDRATPPVSPAQRPEMLVVTGMSGAGRSRAANALEDLDWYVVDNLPPQLLPALAGMMTTVGAGVHRLAAVVDVRSREFFASFMQYLSQLREAGTTVHDLARRIRELVASESDLALRVTVSSFGFKYGIPMDADHVLDVRFIPNPYWVTELRHLTGRDAPVAEYVFRQEGAAAFVDGYADLLVPALPHYVDELKPNVMIAVGCTGGKHRSVASAERIAARLRLQGFNVVVQHRDLGRE